MKLELGIYDTPVADLENFEMSGDDLTCTRHAMTKVAEREAEQRANE